MRCNKKLSVYVFLVTTIVLLGACGGASRSSSPATSAQDTTIHVDEVPARPQGETAITYKDQGDEHMRQGDYTQAIDAYSQAIELDPQYVSAYFGRGNAYNAQENYKAARADYERAIEIDPDYEAALNNLAYLYADALETNLVEATDLAQRALELEGDGPSRGLYLDTLGWVLYKRGMFDEASEALEEAIELEPDHPEVVAHWQATLAALEDLIDYEELGDEHMRQDEYAQAVDAYSRAIELDPQNVSARFNRAYAYHLLGEYNAAIADYQRTIELDSNHAVALNNLAYLYADVLETNLAEATDLAHKALELEGNGDKRAIYLDTLGWVYYKQGLLDEAIEVLKEAIELAPDHPEIEAHWEVATAAVQQRDSDNDGIPDGADQCPGTRSGVAVDTRGCEVVYDSDNDGVPDDADQCSGTRSGVEVDPRGCEVIHDSDNDGVSDNVDQCPGTPRGVIVDATGCQQSITKPLTMADIKALVMQVEKQANHGGANIMITLQSTGTNVASAHTKFTPVEDGYTRVETDLLISVENGRLKVVITRFRVYRDRYTCSFSKTLEYPRGQQSYYDCGTLFTDDVEVYNKNFDVIMSDLERQLAARFPGSIQSLAVQGDSLLITYKPG
jgi:tetratricopeptide (TPR) repeat protein